MLQRRQVAAPAGAVVEPRPDEVLKRELVFTAVAGEQCQARGEPTEEVGGDVQPDIAEIQEVHHRNAHRDGGGEGGSQDAPTPDSLLHKAMFAFAEAAHSDPIHVCVPQLKAGIPDALKLSREMGMEEWP